MDREKVIKGWECHIEADTLGCADCPYREGWRTCCFEDTLYKDVYAVLKEQEELLRKLQNDKNKLCIEVSEWKHKFHERPFKMHKEKSVNPICTGGYMHFETCFVCPTCSEPIFDDARFCSGCGNPVLWEGR